MASSSLKPFLSPSESLIVPDMASAPPPIASSSLRDFLFRDIASQGHRLLLPFLTTTDRLRSSECCNDLFNYRYHLSRVMIVPHPSPSSPGMEEALVCLLTGQMWGFTVKVDIFHKQLTRTVVEVVRSGAVDQHLKGRPGYRAFIIRGSRDAGYRPGRWHVQQSKRARIKV